MDLEYYQALVDDAKSIDGRGYWIGSYGYPPECPYDADKLVKILGIIYDVAHNNVKSIVKHYKTMRTFSNLYRISYITVQQWCNEKRNINDYTLRLIGYTLISQIEGNRQS